MNSVGAASLIVGLRNGYARTIEPVGLHRKIAVQSLQTRSFLGICESCGLCKLACHRYQAKAIDANSNKVNSCEQEEAACPLRIGKDWLWLYFAIRIGLRSNGGLADARPPTFVLEDQPEGELQLTLAMQPHAVDLPRITQVLRGQRGSDGYWDVIGGRDLAVGVSELWRVS